MYKVQCLYCGNENEWDGVKTSMSCRKCHLIFITPFINIKEKKMAKNRKVSDTIEVSSDMIEASALKKIEQLEKENKSLQSKIERREKQIAKLQHGVDLTKEKREEIAELCEQLRSRLIDAGWIEYDEHY